jgi:putative transposase
VTFLFGKSHLSVRFVREHPNFLNYKLDREGGKLIEVDRFFPSTKICHCCKTQNISISLSVRDWVCPECNTHHDRDENAAKNIREEGIRILSTNTVGHTGILFL